MEEELSNEEIIDMISFYRECGLDETMYLDKNGVKDIYSILGIEPETDKFGRRVPTVYEQLAIAPVFRDGKEVPIIFAIKRKINKIVTHNLSKMEFKYRKQRQLSDDEKFLLNLKKLYASAMAQGNYNEAAINYDMIDKITGGKAEQYLGIIYNYINFYKKMKKQLLMDIFANFFIVNLLERRSKVRKGLFRVDKLYRAFVASNSKEEDRNEELNASISSGIKDIAVESIFNEETNKEKQEAEKTSKEKEEKPVEEAQTIEIHEDFINVAEFEKEVPEEDLPKSFINSHVKIRQRVFAHGTANIALEEEQKPITSVLEND